MTKIEVTAEQLDTIKASLLVTLQVASRQQYDGMADPPILEDPQHVKELIRSVFETVGYLEGIGFQANTKEV